MVRRCLPSNRWFTITALVAAITAFSMLSIGCGGAQSGSQTNSSASSSSPDTDPETTPDPNLESSFEGSVSAVMASGRSTRESVAAADGESATQILPASLGSVSGVVSFLDLHGNPLLGPSGEPYPSVATSDAGAFSASNLPVGVDFVIVIDIDGDGAPDIQQIVHIPAGEDGDEGNLDDVIVDPLSTLVAGRLRQLLADSGIDPEDLHISPTAVVQRVVNAYTHLFEEAGIDGEVSLEDIAALDDSSLEALLKSLVPPSVRAGLEAVAGSLALGHAAELEDVVRAAAEVFVLSGFPIADDPGGIDLSFLAELPDVEVKSIEDLMPHDAMSPPRFDGEAPTIYISKVTEPDRNFAGDQDFEEGAEPHHLPILNEHLLTRMAEHHHQGRAITLGNLYQLLTDLEVGLGGRLTYTLPTPGHEGPPPMVFETADGLGTARDFESLMAGLMSSGLSDPGVGFDDLESHEADIREIMRELLDGTVPPSFHRLFGTVVSERIEGAEQLFRFIREARAHLPFSRSGPSSFFVVADGNSFDPEGPDTVNPVTVDIEFDEAGLPARVNYNPSHGGGFYLGFTHQTDEQHLVEPIVIETGRWLHGPHGHPIVLDMDDGSLFGLVDGRPFIDFVSEAGTFYPGIPVPVHNPDFEFGEPGGEYEIGLASMEPEHDATMHLYVLATEPGPGGQPVRVDYRISDETFTYSPDGRYYVTFIPETIDEGVFGLYDANLNFMPTVHDLTADGFIETLPPLPPPDDSLPPPDGEEPPPPDGEPPPPDGEQQPPEGDEPPPNPDEPIDPAQTDPSDGEPTDSGDEPPPPDDGTLPEPDDQPPPDGSVEPPPPTQMARVTLAQIIGLDVRAEFFAFVFGTEAPNPNHKPDGNPYFDDVNGNGTEDPDELTSDHRPVLFDSHDWRSTDMERYYRRASGGGVTFEDIDYESPEPRTRDGEALVPRNFLPRLNAFAYGRPNSAINLLTSFMPPEFFDGRHALDEDTEVGIFQAIAMINLVMEQMFTVEAQIDIDGDGPQERVPTLIDAHLFVLPIADPSVLLLEGFDRLSTPGADD
ncbi:MAG: hypothetical protein GY778_14100 [bacterium]|nr:hypothetical protein [bacterium]